MVLTHRKDIIPFRISPMLATLVDWPFHKPNWIYEEKYDGIRILAYKEAGRVRLLSRNDKDRTKNFPNIVGAIANLSPDTFADSGRCRSAFRAHADHSFRAMSISDSGGCRSLVPG